MAAPPTPCPSCADYDFDGAASRATRDEARVLLKPLSLPHLEYVQIWRRPLHRLPVHKDVPRLLKGMLICETSGDELYRDDGTARPSDPASQVAALRDLMLSLAARLDGPAVVRIIEERLPDYLNPSIGDVAGSLRHFLLESGLPETALFVQIFKAIHQEMIFPAVYALKTSIGTKLQYKDMKGEWRVRVDIAPHEIRVSHLKWEQTQEYDPTEFFKFRWGLTLTFDRRMHSLEHATVHVLDYAFGNVTKPERQKVVTATLKPWLAPGTAYKRVWQDLAKEAVPAAPVVA